jgi:hypothetical protein
MGLITLVNFFIIAVIIIFFIIPMPSFLTPSIIPNISLFLFINI